MIKGLFVVIGCITVSAGCGGLKKAGKIDQFVNPAVQPSSIKRISLIADGADRSKTIMSRARTRFTNAGVTLVVRKGNWETNESAMKDICEQRSDASDNVDAVAFVGWDHITLHDCKSMKVATDIRGSYAGVDALVDKVIVYLGAQPAGTK